ncbi:hypothetical protein LUZ60_004841 [Juncus effusus]|nr:hypothetical protein LUZ60_004841 [Juncus effusus]
MAQKRGRSIVLLTITAFFVLISLTYLFFSLSFARSSSVSTNSRIEAHNYKEGLNGSSECCKGVKGLELWGSSVKSGNKHKVDSAESCCKACKKTDSCNTWVFCGDNDQCQDKYGECWLKKQNDPLSPEIASSGDDVMWTSGNIFAKGEGIFGLETNQGTIRIKLLPEFAPVSVAYMIELLGSKHCAGCRFFRAENRGNIWDSNGDHIAHAGFGPPYALIQGSLEADGVYFKPIQNEASPLIKRGSVAWVGSGPEFFISLANHNKWKNSHNVFGFVLPEDLEIVEKIANLSTKADVWANVSVLVLQDPVYLKVVRASLG